MAVRPAATAALSCLLLAVPGVAWAGPAPLPRADCTFTGVELQIGGPFRAHLVVRATVREPGTFDIAKNVGDDGQKGYLDASGTTTVRLHLSASTAYRLTLSCNGDSTVVTGTTPPPTASPGQSYAPDAVCRFEDTSFSTTASVTTVTIRAVVASEGTFGLSVDGQGVPRMTTGLSLSPDGDYTTVRRDLYGLAPGTRHTLVLACDGDEHTASFVTPRRETPVSVEARAPWGARSPLPCGPVHLPVGRTYVPCADAAVQVLGAPEQLLRAAQPFPEGPVRRALLGARTALLQGQPPLARRHLGLAWDAAHLEPVTAAQATHLRMSLARVSHVTALSIPRLHAVRAGEHVWAILRVQLVRDGLPATPQSLARAATALGVTSRLQPGQVLVLPRFT